MMKKRIISMLLVMALVVGLLPGYVFANEVATDDTETAEQQNNYVPAETTEDVVASGTCGENLTWELTDDGTLTVSGEGAIPDYSYTYGDYGPEVITPWSGYVEQITAIVIGDGITRVGNNAFTGLHYTKSLRLPDTLVSIGEEAFSYLCFMNYMEGRVRIDLTIPEGVENVGANAFRSVYIHDLTIPGTLSYVGQAALGVSENIYIQDLESWCEIDFSLGFANPFVQTKGVNLYVGGELVTDLVIPVGITEIKAEQFAGLTTITSVTIPDTVTHVHEFAFDMYPNGWGSYSQLTSIIFPASVTFIGERSLGFQENLTQIYILNPECEINADLILRNGYFDETIFDMVYPEITVYGFSGSTAEAYAAEAGFNFVSLTEYEITEGADCTVRGNNSHTIRANGEFSKFEGVAVDGLLVAASDYSVSEGSTIVTFSADFIGTLLEGEHSITMYFSDGVAFTSMTVVKTEPGDANGDGQINVKDVVLLRQHLAGWEVEIDLQNADANGDGTVNVKDVVLLRQYLAGWDVTLGPEEPEDNSWIVGEWVNITRDDYYDEDLGAWRATVVEYGYTFNADGTGIMGGYEWTNWDYENGCPGDHWEIAPMGYEFPSFTYTLEGDRLTINTEYYDQTGDEPDVFLVTDVYIVTRNADGSVTLTREDNDYARVYRQAEEDATVEEKLELFGLDPNVPDQYETPEVPMVPEWIVGEWVNVSRAEEVWGDHTVAYVDAVYYTFNADGTGILSCDTWISWDVTNGGPGDHWDAMGNDWYNFTYTLEGDQLTLNVEEYNPDEEDPEIYISTKVYTVARNLDGSITWTREGRDDSSVYRQVEGDHTVEELLELFGLDPNVPEN